MEKWQLVLVIVLIVLLFAARTVQQILMMRTGEDFRDFSQPQNRGNPRQSASLEFAVPFLPRTAERLGLSPIPIATFPSSSPSCFVGAAATYPRHCLPQFWHRLCGASQKF